MNDLVSYLLAQAQYRPVATARFVAGEIWRRSRLRLSGSLEEDLPSFSTYRLRSRFRAFYPAGAMESAEFGSRFLRAAEVTLERAEQIHRHEFDIFGERVTCGPQIDWHADWKSGHHWPLGRAGELRTAGAAPGSDVKRPWELARFHHLLTLGKAFLLTQDARHAAELAAQVRHWIAENPFPRGIHWAMPMEAAIRAVNWIAASAFFAQNGALEDAFWQEFLRALFLHGRFVYAHREWNPVARGNHYLACVVGLLHLGAFFHDQEEAQGWWKFARRELAREMATQVREDGVAHEGSSGYHVFLTELFLTGALLLARMDACQGDSEETADLKVAATGAVNALQAPEAWAQLSESCGKQFAARLEKMFEFMAALTAGRECAPILGDSDDGRLLPVCGVPLCGTDAAAHLLSVGRALLGRADWPMTRHTCEEVWWRLGHAPEERRASEAPPQCAAFAPSGYYFFASPRMRGSIRCGPLGVNGWSNHAHCDQLSVEFAWEGHPVVVDPGTYLYSGDGAGRNLFRSTRYHNTVVVAGKEQNRFWPGLVFRIVDDTRSLVRKWEVNGQRVEFLGEHVGYKRLPLRVRVQRRVVLERERLLVSDVVRGRGGRAGTPVEWFFHLAPGIEPVRLTSMRSRADDVLAPAPEAEGLLLRAAWRIGPVMLLAFALAGAGRLEAHVERGWVSPRYGQRVEAAVLRFRCVGKLPLQAAFVFRAAEECGANENPQR